MTQSARNIELAWADGRPPIRPDYDHPVPPDLKAGLLTTLSGFVNCAQAEITAMQPVTTPTGGYRLQVDGQAFFVRVNPRPGDPELETNLGRTLYDRGAPVNHNLAAGLKLDLAGQRFRVDVRPWIDGRHFNGSLDDAVRTAAALRQIHDALADNPWAEDVRARAAQRLARLEEVRRSIARAVRTRDFAVFEEQADWAGENRTWLTMLALFFQPRFDLLPGAQCLHGDVHPANVMFDDLNGEAVLVDLEETVHVYAPPGWDQAFLFQRFCLADDPNRTEATCRREAITRAYGRPLGDLSFWMRQLAWFSIAAIVDLRISQRLITPLAEYEKFVRLERQAQKYDW